MADERRDSDSGQFTSEISDEDIISAVAELNPAGTSEVADKFDLTQQSAYHRLSQLEDKNEIKSKMVGGNRIWIPR